MKKIRIELQNNDNIEEIRSLKIIWIYTQKLVRFRMLKQNTVCKKDFI